MLTWSARWKRSTLSTKRPWKSASSGCAGARTQEVREAGGAAPRPGFALGVGMALNDHRLMTRPERVSTAVDSPTNDVLPYSDILMAIYMGCTSVRTGTGVPYTMGPCG